MTHIFQNIGSCVDSGLRGRWGPGSKQGFRRLLQESGGGDGGLA